MTDGPFAVGDWPLGLFEGGDTMEDLLYKLIEIVESAAPALWEIARRQVFANTLASTLWAIASFMSVGICTSIALYFRRQDRRSRSFEDHEGAIVCCAFVGVGSLVVFLVCITSIVYYAANPDYYAIKVLMAMVK